VLIQRDIQPLLLEDAKSFPVVGILGPRQSGKTTLARAAFPNYKYISLEDMDMRSQVMGDPRSFLEIHKNLPGLILDEFQNVPTLLSYIQTHVDEVKKPGFFVLTGSQNFLMNQAITQTLAGRISLHTLLPLSISELKRHGTLPQTMEQAMYQGFYPTFYGETPPANRWFASYIQTYLERDIRNITNVLDLNLFQTFTQLCAARVGQVLNMTALGNDCGISDTTVQRWLSLLEASYIVFFVHPYYKNFNKRIVKSPKLYFYDSGLACSLLKISKTDLPFHSITGGLFESMVMSDIMKQYHAMGTSPRVYFWHEQSQGEVDCIIEHNQKTIPIEIKAGRTVVPQFFKGLSQWNKLVENPPSTGYVIYGGSEDQTRPHGRVISWQSIDTLFQTTIQP
jgi:predicted AAA+ superfamily ATPase